MAITYVGKSSFASGTAALSVGAVSGVAADDLLLLFVESANQPVAAPSGYTQVTNSPVAIGTAAAAGGVALQVFYRIATGADTTTTVADSGDHTTAIKMAFRGVSTSTPFDATPVSGTKTTASTSSSYPGITTATANAMVVYASALDLDAASTATTSGQANANLTSVTERHDQTTSSGFGGGLVITTGMKATAGATGNLTATVTSTTQVYLTLALRPSPPVITGDLAVTEAYSQRDTAKLMQAGTTWPATGPMGDALFGSVAVLLHMDGADGSTTFTDVKGNPTYGYNSAAVTTSPAKFGGALNLPAFNSFLRTSGLSIAPSLTAEFWVYIPSSVNVSSTPLVLLSAASSKASDYITVRLDTDGVLRCYAKYGSFVAGSYAGTLSVAASDTAVSRNAWHHVAFYINGYSTLQGFLDGVKSSTDASFGVAMVDNLVSLDVTGVGCYFDDLRLTAARQRYAGTTYAVPTAPLPDQLPASGPAAAQATLTGTLTSLVSASLGAGITASAALAAALTTSAPVAAALSAGANLSPALTTSIRPAAGLAASSALSASLSTAKPLAATLGAQAGLSGLLQSQAAALQTTTAASAALSGALTTARLIQASLGASSAVSAVLATQIRTTAGLQASPALSGALTTQVRLASALAGQAGVTAALSTQISAQAAMAAQSALTGDLSGVAAQLTAQLQCSPGLTATLQATLPLQAVLTARSALTLVVGSAVPLQALVAARALAVGALAPTARSARGWLVPAQARGWGVPAQTRVWALPAQGPMYQVPAQERSWGVPAQERIAEVQGEARVFVVPGA